MANENENKYAGLEALGQFLTNLHGVFAPKNHSHTVDSAMSSTSTNPVQNKVIDAEFDAVSTAMGILEAEIDKKSDAGHNHNTAYDTKGAASSALSEAKEYVDTVASGKASTEHNHDDDYDAIGAANTALASAKGYTDTKVNGLASTSSVNTSISTHNTSTTAHGDIRELITTLSTNVQTQLDAKVPANRTVNGKALSSNITLSASDVGADAAGTAETKSNDAYISSVNYTDEAINAVALGFEQILAGMYGDDYDAGSNTIPTIREISDSSATKVKNDLLNGAGTAYDTLKELGDLIVDNADAIDVLEDIASGKADATHTHAIADVTGLQSALDGKAASSHGTHVSYSTTAPVMDGTASVGTASTVARSDHKHPTDTSRASKTEFDSHTSDTTVHITSTERTNWNAAKTHADSAHAPSDAEKNQNAFSNVTVGSTTIAADSATDTLTLVAGTNVTITPDATNDKITINVPIASGTQAGATIVYPAASCTTFSSDSGTVTPLAVQKGAELFAITRPPKRNTSNPANPGAAGTCTTNNIVRWLNTAGDVQDSKITIEDVTNTRDTSKTANVLVIPAEGGKKMVYGYCTDQVDGTSFIGGVFDADATSYPYAQGLAIGGTSGNLLWKGSRVIDASCIGEYANKYTLPAATSSTLGGVKVGSNITNSSGTISLTKANVTSALGYTPPTTDTNTTYTFATGDSNGQIKITPSGGSAQNVSVKGLGTAAYTASTAYATAAQGTLASNAMPKSGGTFTGAVTYTTLSGGNITSSGTITGAKVYGAVYNDYAELFPRGEETEPGDLIALDLNSEEEKYIKARENSMVVGVHSNEFSHLIGGEIPPEGIDFVEYNLPKYIPVGLMGRCHVKVVGKVFKGEFICPSSIPGVGCSYNPSCEGLTEIVGRAVENKDDDGIGLVKIVLGR